jgi:hypothetical protein
MFSYLETRQFYFYGIAGAVATLFGTAAIYTMYGMNPHIFFALFAIVFAPIIWFITAYLYFHDVKQNDWETRMITAAVWVLLYLVLHFVVYGFFTGHIILDTVSGALIQFQWVNLAAIVFGGFAAKEWKLKK